MRLLCVEDEAALREDLVEYLRMKNYEVDEAASGVEAIARMNGVHYDLVISDIKMPDMDGYDLLKEVRGENKLVTTPFVFLSALNEKTDKIRAQDGGCDAYLNKPIDFSVLDATLRSHIQRQRARNFVFDSTLESTRGHVASIIDTALNGSLRQANESIQAIREQAPATIEKPLADLTQAIEVHRADLTLLQDTLKLQTRAVDLVRQSISVSSLMRQVLGNTQSLDAQPKQSNLYGDQRLLALALSALRNVVPEIYAQEDCVQVFMEEDRCLLSVCDHPRMIDEGEFIAIDGATDLTALSETTQQRVIPLMFAMQVAQAHGGKLEIKLWPEGYLAVRMVIPQVVSNQKQHKR